MIVKTATVKGEMLAGLFLNWIPACQRLQELNFILWYQSSQAECFACSDFTFTGKMFKILHNLHVQNMYTAESVWH